VIVTIAGLTAIGDAFATPPANALMPKILYLPEARNLSAPLMKHTPIILISDDYTPMVTRRPVYSVFKSKYVEIENGEELTFKEPDPASNVLDYDEDPPDGLCPSDDEESSLYFFPRLHRVARTSSGAKPVFKDLDPKFTKPALDPANVAGFINMTYGTITANVTLPVVWAFKETENSTILTHEQELGDTAEWTFTIPGKTLTIQTNKGPSKDVIELHADSSNKIRLTIANAPDDGIHFLAKDPTTPIHTPGPVDTHFSVYYRFLADKGAKLYLPTAVGVCKGGNLSTDLCDLSQFVDVKRPARCMASPAALEVDGVNCGAGGIP
jgi:hypothetical protein